MSSLFAITMSIIAASDDKDNEDNSKSVVQNIKAAEGGVINVISGIQFVIPAGALVKDTNIQLKITKTSEMTMFVCEPKGTKFKPSAKLQAKWEAVSDAKEKTPTLYYGEVLSNGKAKTLEAIQPETSEGGVSWNIDHFSIYYYVRR